MQELYREQGGNTMNSPEQFQGSVEHGAESQRAAQERSAELLKSVENSVESSPEHQVDRVEKARHETEAAFSKEAGKEREGGEPSGFSRAIKRVTSEEKRAAYQQTMKRIRSEMSAPARAFSKFIHNRSVESASGILGNSVARPNAVLSGSTCALILVSSLYIVTRIFGYPLSGFETIGAFVLGWILGLIYDYAHTLVTGRTS